MYGPGYEGACRKGEGGVDTLQAAELPCSVSNGPVKKVKTSEGSLKKKTVKLYSSILLI